MRMWEKHLAACLKHQRKEDPKNNKTKADYLPKPLCSWWVGQRRNYKVYLDGGKVVTGSMTKERADKLIAAGVVSDLSDREKTWDESLAEFLELKGKKDPKNTEPKTKHLPAPNYNWWAKQRRNYNRYLDVGKVDTDQMNKERADKLIAAGMVGCRASLAPGQGAADGDDDPSQNSCFLMPEGWITCYDSISGRPYYVQEATGQMTWDFCRFSKK